MSMKNAGASFACATFISLVLPVLAVAADNSFQGITLAHESPDQWRASKIVGVTIYGPDNRMVGKITDALMGHDGTTQDVVVGVGGFLGIGEKDVAIPFAAVNFSDKPMPVTTEATNNNLAMPAPSSENATAAPGAAQPNGGIVSQTPGMGLSPDAGSTANDKAMGSNAAIAAAPRTATPYYGTIAFTVDQLKSAPSFAFSR